jgi:hypothetical protein
MKIKTLVEFKNSLSLEEPPVDLSVCERRYGIPEKMNGKKPIILSRI